MPTEAAVALTSGSTHPVATRRILRLALGTALSLWFSQVVNWPMSFIAPVFTALILGLPLPPPTLKKGIAFVVALLAPMVAGMSLLPFLNHARWAGVLLVALGLYYSFYYSAKGGSPVMGTFMTIGLTLIVTIGSVNADVIFLLVQSLALGAAFGIAFVWIGHALLPDPPPDPALTGKRPPPPTPDLAEARRSALRSMLIVFPIALAFLFMSGSPAYTVVMIKVASMGQQASSDHSRTMGRALLESTLWGGAGAIIAWTLLNIWPSLLLYVLLIALAALLFGRGFFQGPALHPKFSMWSYAFTTLIVILAPAVIAGEGGSGASANFWSRLLLFALIAVYGTVAVAVFDAFWPGNKPAAR
jgi:hypothetical protein